VGRVLESVFSERGSHLLRDPRDSRVEPGVKGSIYLAGIPWDWSTAGRPGAREAPEHLRRALYSMRRHAPSKRSDFNCGIVDVGDVRVAPGDHVTTMRRVGEASRSLVSTAEVTVFLGGDHSITEWILNPLLGDASVGIVVFDAHYDIRSVEEGYTSGSWLWSLVSKWRGRVSAVVIGVEDYVNPPYLAERAREAGLRIVTAAEVRLRGVEAVAEALEGLAARAPDFYYLSIDMDHVNQAYAPGVNAPNPLGLTPWESSEAIGEAARLLRPRVIDLVEVSPPHDVGGSTARLAARLLIEALHQATGGCIA